MGAFFLLATALYVYPVHWDRKGAQTALARARHMRAQLSVAQTPSRERYLHCVRTYQTVYLKDPHFGGSDDAVFEEGEIYQEMGEKFGTLLYYKNAAKLFRFLIKEYSRSTRCPEALLLLGDLLSGPLEDDEGAQEAYKKLRTQYAGSKAAAALTMKKSVPPAAPRQTQSTTAATQQDLVAAMAWVQNIRHWSTSDYTRVIIDMDTETRYTKTRLANPDRIFFDISNSKLNRDLLNKTFVVGDAFLKQVRVGQNRLDVVRVVLDFAAIGDYTVFELHEPFRIVVDIHGARETAASSGQVPPEPSTSKGSENKNAPAVPVAQEENRTETQPLVREETPPALPVNEKPTPAMSPPSTKPAATAETSKETRPAAEKAAAKLDKLPDMKPSGEKPPIMTEEISSDPSLNGRAVHRTPVKVNAVTSNKAGHPAPPPIIATEPPPLPKTAAPTSKGDRTLTRMLGLKIGRIVLDPGHGGHDTGTIGPGGMLEKDLVLQVARSLRKMLSEKLGAEVVLTRDDDRFISLEERTAIANQARADLFVSIHANSSRSRITSGVETYYLNFARTDAEREVAARENASTVRNISDLQNLIRKIAQADKSAESRELAAILQNKLYGGARQLFPAARNRGVRSAPFVVLIGANMPSVLAEVAFISNPRDEKVLKQDGNQLRLAQALFAGIEGYMKTLGSDVAQSHVGSN